MEEQLRRLDAALGPEGGGPATTHSELSLTIKKICEVGPPALTDLHVLRPKLLAVARDYSYCEDDPDHHVACEAMSLLGLLGLSDPQFVAAIEKHLRNARPPKCVQHAAIVALYDIGTPEAVKALQRTERRTRKWIANFDCRRYRSLLAAVQRLLLRLKDR